MTADDIVNDLADVLLNEYQSRARAVLLAQSKDWLVAELLARLPGVLVRKDRSGTARALARPEVETERDRARRRERIKAWKLDATALTARIERLKSWSRQRLEADGFLLDPPPMGTAVIGPVHRSLEAENLLRETKDFLYAMLFEEGDDVVQLLRVERELLTLTLPCSKEHVLAPMLRAMTEISARGTWRDEAGRASDESSANIILEVEYGEVADGMVRHGIAASLRIINYLELNEQVLYARIESVKESTLSDAAP
jgi:hypothetical protein